jgi:hypothetical protein
MKSNLIEIIGRFTKTKLLIWAYRLYSVKLYSDIMLFHTGLYILALNLMKHAFMFHVIIPLI